MATYGFDFADRQESLTVQQGANPPQTLVSGATYLPSGPLSSLTLGNGLTETRTYDGRYLPTGVSVPNLFDWTYTTDGEGNILQITDNLSPADSRAYGYQDIVYFLTQGDGPWGVLSWTYDRIGNRLTETRDGATDTYAYTPNAAAGNTALLSQITLGVGGTRDYQYGPAGHLELVTAGANQVLFTSDNEGRLARLERPAAGASTPFTYDGRSFLAEAGSPPPIFSDGFESGDLSCWSSALGGSTAGTCPPPPPAPEQVRPVYSSDGLLHALGKGSTSQDLFYFAGRPVAQRDSATGNLLFLTTDHLGTPVVATDTAGVEVWSGGFEPFGEDYAGAQAAGVFLRFPGQWMDGVWEEASLGVRVYYNLHRWLEPGTGRYTKPEPKWEADFRSINHYFYAAANPASAFDPDGQRYIPPPAAGFVTNYSDCPVKVVGDPGPFEPSGVLIIPPGGVHIFGKNRLPGLSPALGDVDFVCLGGTWFKIRGPASIGHDRRLTTILPTRPATPQETSTLPSCFDPPCVCRDQRSNPFNPFSGAL